MLKAGDTLGRFKLVRELGQGSFGVVFEAEDVLVGEAVAIKALHPWYTTEPTLRERFRRELLFTRRITHPGVCRVHELHEHDDVLFISMQLVKGRTLLQVIKADRPPPLRAVRLVRQMCQALQAAHSEGVVHRDLKPANVLVTDDDRVVILDFGIASGSGAHGLTRPGEALGSLPYVPLEVWEGQPATAAGDQYALGVTAFVALTAALPYTGKTPSDFRDALRLERPSLRHHLPTIDHDLEWAVLKAMSVMATDRFSSVAAFDQALQRVEEKLAAGDDGGGEARAITGAIPGASQAIEAGTARLRPAPPTSASLSSAPTSSSSSSVMSMMSPGLAELPHTAPDHEDARPSAPPASPTGPLTATASATVVLPRPSPAARRTWLAAGLVLGGIVLVGAVVAVDGAVAGRGVAVPTVDAGVLVSGDSVAVDAGAGAAGAAPADQHDDDVAVEADVGPDAGTTMKRPAVSRTANRAAVNRVTSLVRRRGLRTGDDPAVDAAILEVQRKAAGPADDLQRSVKAAEAAIGAVHVDKSFINAKLSRFNRTYGGVKDAAVRGRVEPVTADVVKHVAAGDWEGANRRLNDAFAIVSRR